MEAILYEKQIELVDTQRPFQGLRSYEEKNKTQFGGRDAEISELFNLVETNRLTIVFGKSGIGKTSLLNAGLIPELQNSYFFPVYIRVDYSSVKTPLDQVRELVYEKLKTADPTVPEPGNLTLWEYFCNLRLYDGLLTPVLIFDQFEEIFTIGKEKRQPVQEFITELSDLAENRVPMVVQEERQNKSEKAFSQYEEQNFHVIISLREDYLAQLESLKGYLPSIKNSRFRVVQMSVFQAMDAVMKPAKNLIDKEVAVAIIKKLPGISELDFEASATDQESVKKLLVEPFLLSLICYEINEKRIENGLDKINLDLVSQFDISDVINSYYTKTMHGFSENVQQGVEDSMLTEGGFRKLQSLEELEKEYKINNNDIQKLIEKRIIRKELRDGVEYVELIHDVLAPVIKAKRDKRITILQEKEKTEAIQRAIKLDRDKRNKFLRTALLLMLPVLAVLLWITVNKNINSKRKYENLAFANKLLVTSRIISNSYADVSTAALVSRTAYMINRDNNGGGGVNFYNSMYESSIYLRGVNFEVAKNDFTSVRSIADAGNDIFYFACVNGKIYKINLADSTQQLVNDFDSRISSIVISPDKRYMAVAGVFNDVKIIDLLKGGKNSESLPTGDTAGAGKTVCFTNDGRLILRLQSKIIGWEINSWKPISWKQKIRVEVNNGNQEAAVNEGVSESKDYFDYGGIEFSSMSVFRDKIALGIDSGVILITKDSVFKIKSNDVDKTSSIEFDPAGEHLFIGDNPGTLCRMSLADFSTENNQYQTARITDITFSSNGNFMASSSFDGSTAIWDMNNNWSSLTPLILLPPGEKSFIEDITSSAYCVAFSKTNDYVLTGYFNGKILKWPVNMDILADLICSHANASLNTSVLKKVIKRDDDLKKIIKYSCNVNSVVK